MGAAQPACPPVQEELPSLTGNVFLENNIGLDLKTTHLDRKPLLQAAVLEVSRS